MLTMFSELMQLPDAIPTLMRLSLPTNGRIHHASGHNVNETIYSYHTFDKSGRSYLEFIMRHRNRI